MAKQSINVSTPNSGNGDPLRTAFVKINSNFTELYAALGLDVGGLNLGAFQFSGSTMTTTDSTPMVLNQAVSVTGDLTVGGDLLPNSSLQVNLGSPTKKWHSIYVGTGSVYIGDAKLSLEGGTLNSSVGFSTDSLIIGGNVLTVNESGVLQSTGGINGGAGGGSTLTNGSYNFTLGVDGTINFDPSTNGKGVLQTTADLQFTAGVNTWVFGQDGSIAQNNTWTCSVNTNVNAPANSAVVWTSKVNYISGAKLTIQVEANEVGDSTGWHSQVCEAVIASRGYANSYGGPGGEPVMTVYGVTHTSSVPLVTFSVQRNPVTKKIEVVGTMTAAADGGAYLRIYSVEKSTRD
jgi:hypothetical protein